MKMHTQPARGRSAASMTRLRRLGAALTIAPLVAVAVAACSTEAPVTDNPTASSTAEVTTPVSSPTSSAPSSATSTAPTATPNAQPTKRNIDITIKDPTIGHQIRAIQVVRNLPFPKGNPIAAQTLEIVGVRLKVTAGDRYSAPLMTNQLSLRSGTTDVLPTREFGNMFGTLLTTVERGQSETGWVIFKIDQGVHPIVLQYARPAYKVSTTKKSIPAHTFWAKLTD